MLVVLYSAFILGFSAAIESGDDSEHPGLPAGRCIPTAVVVGPCHHCVCQEDGAFLCRNQDCSPADAERDNLIAKSQECVPNILYRDEILWCSCTESGQWRSSNCRQNYRYVRAKTAIRNHFTYSNLSCDADAYYAVDCNVCQCKNGKFLPASCTNRTCVNGVKADSCVAGQLLRTANQLCACSQIGYYVDKLCISTNNSFLHKLSVNDLKDLTQEENLKQLTEKKCVPKSIIKKDCNVCTCTEDGRYLCTDKKCSPDDYKNTTLLLQAARAAVSLPKLDKLEKLKSLKDKCKPGVKYRYHCNSCMCTKKGIPICSTMMCLDDLTVDNKKIKDKFGIGRTNEDGFKVYDIGLKGPCKVLKIYMIDDLPCVCTPEKRIMCAKKAYILRSDTKKQAARNKPVKRESSDSTGSLDKGVIKLHKRSYDNRPQLPKGACSPGVIYSEHEKSCQRCFCNDEKKALCTDRPCKEMRGGIQSPADVRPPFTDSILDALPKLPNSATECRVGKAYKIDCNACLCLANGNLLCDTLMCLNVAEVNSIAAKKLSGQSCNEGVPLPPVPDSCAKCTCRNNKIRCIPMSKCTPKALKGLIQRSNDKKRLNLDSQTPCLASMVYSKNCNLCYCQRDGSLRCTRKGCLNYQQVQKLQKQRMKLLAESGSL